MPARKNGLGLLLGLIAGWLAVASVNHASRYLVERLLTVDDDRNLPWLGALLLIGLVIGVVLAASSIRAGALTGLGLYLMVLGLAAGLLPVQHAVKLEDWTSFPGDHVNSYVTWDGSIVLFGVILLTVGIRLWARRPVAGYPTSPNALPTTYPKVAPTYPTSPTGTPYGQNPPM